MPTCQSAAISLVFPGGRIDTPAATDEAARAVDRIQYETGQGPCLDAIREHESFLTADLAQEGRWPQFAAERRRKPASTACSGFGCSFRKRPWGRSTSTHVRSAPSTTRTGLSAPFAAHAALAMSSAQERHTREGLEVALGAAASSGWPSAS